MKSNQYWEKRAQERMKSYHKDADKTVQLILKAYEKAQKDIQKQIDTIFETYAKNGNLSPEEAQRLLNQKIPNPLLKLAKKIYENTKNEKLRKWLLKRLNAPAYRARITRLEALKESIHLRTKELANVEISLSESSYLKTINSAYYRTMFDIQRGTGYGFEFAQMSDKQIEEILLNPWSGEHFSERVWGNTEVLAEKVSEIITSGFMSGASHVVMAKELAEMFNVGMFAANRLIRTETTFMANMAEMLSYEEAEIEKYRFIATLDLRTSEPCRKMDSKVFLVKDAKPGVNMPPLHPFCRSTTIAYFGEEELENIQRRARDPITGKTYLVPANMSYEQWRKDIAEKYGHDTIGVIEKKIQNRWMDKRQHKEYKKVLGKHAPKSFAEFQEIKYNKDKIEEWSELKELYRNVNWQLKAQENLVEGSNRNVAYQGEPNSVFDNYKDGKLESRRYYGRTGKPRLDIDFSNHGNSKTHPVVPHAHDWFPIDDSSDNTKREKTWRKLTLAEEIANQYAIERRKENERSE